MIQTFKKKLTMEDQKPLKEKMIKLCEEMIKVHSESKSILAPVEKSIWLKKLEYWNLM